MPTHTDSQIIEHNEDGSKTITTVETQFPLTKAQKAQGWLALGTLVVVPVMPFVAIAAIEKAERWNERRKARKSEKK